MGCSFAPQNECGYSLNKLSLIKDIADTTKNNCLPWGQDLQSCARVPGALSYATKEPVGHVLQFSATWPRLSE